MRQKVDRMVSTVMNKSNRKPDDLTPIGRNAAVDFIGHVDGIPAKVDTGADSSSVWASDISVDEQGVLHFRLFAEDSPYYTGELLRREQYKVAVVRSSSGHEQIRYRVQFSLRISGRRIRATVNLSDRSRNKFPMLIGRRTLSGRFVVNVSQAEFSQHHAVETVNLNKEMEKNPYAFYKKYYGKDIIIG